MEKVSQKAAPAMRLGKPSRKAAHAMRHGKNHHVTITEYRQ